MCSPLLQSKYACFGGAGMFAVSYVGALQALSDSYPEEYAAFVQGLEGACGTSSGSIMALCLLTQLEPETMHSACEILCDNNMAPSFEIGRFMNDYGADSGSTIRAVIENVLSFSGLSPNTTFADFYRLTRKQFVCCATKLASGAPFLFSHTNTPGVKLSDALFMSMCLPLIFAPIQYEKAFMIDGGLSCNVPHHVFPVESTLIMYQIRSENEINSLRDYMYALVSCSLSAQYIELEKKRQSDPAFHRQSIVIEFKGNNATSVMRMNMSHSARDKFSNLGYAAVVCRLFPSCVDTLASILHECIMVAVHCHDARATEDILLCNEDDCTYAVS